MNNETKKVKWYNRLFAILGIILVLIAGVFSGFKLGEAYMQEQDPTVTFASVDINGTTYDWQLDSYVFPNILGAQVWYNTRTSRYTASNGAQSFEYDVSNHTWTQVSFTGYSNVTGSNIWSDGTNTYIDASTNHFVQNGNYTWTSQTWSGVSNSWQGSRVWTDGVDYYYSYNSNQYKLDTSTHTVSSMTWYGLTSFIGQYVWFDGTNYRYDYNGTDYILNVATHTWSAFSWTGGNTTYLRGDMIFQFNGNYYCLYNNRLQLVNGSAGTLTLLSGDDIFTLANSQGSNYLNIDNNLYYIDGSMLVLAPVQSGGGDTPPDVPGSDSVVDTFLSQAISINTIGMMQNYDSTDPNWIVQDWHDCANAYFYFSIDATTVETTHEITVGFNFAVSGVIYSGSETFNIGDEDNAGDGSGQIELTNQNYNTVITVDVDFSEYGLVSNLNFYRVMYSSSYDTDTISGTNYRYRYDMLTLTNFDTGFIRFTFSGVASQVDNADWYNIMNYTGWCDDVHTRTYYLTYALSNNESYDTGYEQGFADGSVEGSADGYTDGYDDGYGAGYNVGYGVGYNTGSSDSNQYTFINLIGATIDAPISAFRGLFNFSVFGVNMTDFLTALFSITLVIVILKFVLVK